jgi:hypothetical protein
LKTPSRNARSPPVWTANHSSAKRVPNTADSAIEGTQYRRRPGSKYVLTTATRVPCCRAWYRYFMVTGWLFGVFEPKKTTRSLPIQSV